MKAVVKFEGKKIEISAKANGTHYSENKYGGGTVNQFKITLSYDGRSTSFDFFDSIYNYNQGKKLLLESELPWCLYCFISDALAGQMSFDDFMGEFGYEDWKEGKRVWKACGKMSDKYDDLFDDDFDIYDFINYIQETYEC